MARTLVRPLKLLKKMSANGNLEIDPRDMLAVGYSKSYSNAPTRLKSTIVWQELTEKYLPDLDLLAVHKEGLKAVKRSTSLTEPDTIDPDYAVRHKYLETGYKIKGKLKDFEFPPSQGNTNVLILQMTEEKLNELIARAGGGGSSGPGTNPS